MEMKTITLSKKEIDRLREYIFELLKNKKIKDSELKLNIAILEVFLFDIITNNKYHKIFNSGINNKVLRKFDLSEVDFKDVAVYAKDFTGTNAIINPQTVFEKDMRWGKYPLNFIGKSFDGVKVSKANFTGATNVNMDPQTVYGKDMSGGIYPFNFFNKSFQGVKKSYSDLTGATFSYEITAASDEDIEAIYNEIDKTFSRVKNKLFY